MKVYRGSGAPTTTTFGNVGDYYLDVDKDKMYKCVDVVDNGREHQFVTIYNQHPDHTEYKWEATAYGIKDFSYFCRYDKRINELEFIDMSNGINFYGMFQDCTNLTSVPVMNLPNAGQCTWMFSGCTKLETIPALNLGERYATLSNIFKGCTQLKNLSMTWVWDSLDLSDCSLLTVESIASVVAALVVTHPMNGATLTLSSSSWVAIQNVKCKIVDKNGLPEMPPMGDTSGYTFSMVDMELCDNQDPDAMSLMEYAALKYWTITGGGGAS